MNKLSLLLVIAICSMSIVCITDDKVCGQSSEIVLDQSIVQTVTVTNKNLITFFAEDFMIPEKKVSRLVIYDLNGDGFGDTDLARTYPAGRYYLIAPGSKAQKIMNNWSFGGNIKFTANSDDPPEMFEQVPDSLQAMGAIFSALLKGLRRNYKGQAIKLHLEQGDDVTSLEMWGYNSNLMQYQPPPVVKMAVEKPVMKLIYLEKTVVDSVLYNPRLRQ